MERPQFQIDLDREIGRRYDVVPETAMERARDLLDLILGEIPPFALRLAPFIRERIAAEFEEELMVCAEMARRDWQEVAIANVSYDLALASFGCSTVALATAEGPVLVRNVDWPHQQALARASFLYRYVRGEQLAYGNASWPGTMGVVTGLSGRGFALAINAVSSPEGLNRGGYPVLLHLRNVVSGATDFRDALRLISRPTLASSCLVTLVGTENGERVCIERTPTRFALRWGSGEEPLITTNDYRLLECPGWTDSGDLAATACSRYEALAEMAPEIDREDALNDDRLLRMISDPRVLQETTAQHVIARPRSGQMRLFVPRRLI